MENNLLCLHHRQKNWWYEVASSRYHRGGAVPAGKIETFQRKNAGKEDHHISVFEHDQEWLGSVKANESVSGVRGWVRVSSLWIELDRKRDGGFKRAKADAEKFLEKFPYGEHVRLWTSGNQSIHIEINGALFGYPSGRAELLCGRGNYIYNLAHDLFGSIRHEGGPVDPWLNYKESKEYYLEHFGPLKQGFQQDLENIDPNIYGVNSLIRAKYSKHEKGKKNKECIYGKWEFPPVQPIMLDVYVGACEVRKRKSKKPEIDIDESLIIQEFLDIEGFAPDNADSEGWVRDLHNPFYADNKPSLSVNIENGMFWDFGDPNYQFGFVKYIMNKYSFDFHKAKQYIEGA